MPATEAFRDVVTSVAELRTHYREVSPIAQAKDRPTIDDETRRFIHLARFATVATYGADGTCDVSPRGGPSGFIRVLDERRLAIADLPGNNRLDSLANIVATGRVGLLIVVPGQCETVRLNGRAWITTDPEVLAGFELGRHPVAAIGVEVETTFMHCAKSLRRAGLWAPEEWPDAGKVPDGASILAAQGAVPGATAAQIRTALDEGYDRALAAEGH